MSLKELLVTLLQDCQEKNGNVSKRHGELLNSDGFNLFQSVDP